MKKQKGSLIISVFAIVLVALISVSGTYLFLKNQKNIPVKNTTTSASNETKNTIGWKTYTDSEYKISFDYPQDMQTLIVDHFEEPYPFGSRTINFIIKDGPNFVPTTLAIKIYITSEPKFDLGKTIIERIKDQTSKDGTRDIYSVKIGNKNAERVDEHAGMLYGQTLIYWTSKEKAVTIGSQSDLFVYPEPYKALGDPPYTKDNYIISQILSTFKFLP